MKPLLITEDAYSGKPNPHAWMSPQRTMGYVDHLERAFSQLDPAGAEDFAANASAYKAKLQALDQELRKSIAALPAQQRLLVSCEGAFTYLAADYGLEEAYLWPVNAESEITPKRMARLIDTVREREVPAVFCESTVSDKAQGRWQRRQGRDSVEPFTWIPSRLRTGLPPPCWNCSGTM